jgi:hypothetical protein
MSKAQLSSSLRKSVTSQPAVSRILKHLAPNIIYHSPKRNLLARSLTPAAFLLYYYIKFWMLLCFTITCIIIAWNKGGNNATTGIRFSQLLPMYHKQIHNGIQETTRQGQTGQHTKTKECKQENKNILS